MPLTNHDSVTACHGMPRKTIDFAMAIHNAAERHDKPYSLPCKLERHAMAFPILKTATRQKLARPRHAMSSPTSTRSSQVLQRLGRIVTFMSRARDPYFRRPMDKWVNYGNGIGCLWSRVRVGSQTLEGLECFACLRFTLPLDCSGDSIERQLVSAS